MGVFYTVHPLPEGDVVYGNCDLCGVAQAIPGAIYFELSEEEILDMEMVWASTHVCADPDLYGLIEYYDEEKAARFYGLPHFF